MPSFFLCANVPDVVGRSMSHIYFVFKKIIYINGGNKYEQIW